MSVDPARVRAGNDAPERRRGYVLYWMTAARRTRSSPALEHAVARARALGRPLVVLEALRAGYRWASDRLHAFVLQGMADQRAAFAAAGVTYLAYVEPEAGAGRGLLEALAARACLVIADDAPTFFLPRMVAAAAARLDVRVEVVDGVGVLPVRAFERGFVTAASFRRAWQRAVIPHLLAAPAATPLSGAPDTLRGGEVPGALLRRWPMASDGLLAAEPAALARLPIDHEVGVVALRGGARAAARVLKEFVADRLGGYHEDRSHPDDDAGSGLSPYLHFGHLSAAEAVSRVLAHEGWDPSRSAEAVPAREGWWGLSPGAEGFLDELITWRELGHNGAAFLPEHDRYESLPAWARRTLEAHAGDPRDEQYTMAELAGAATGDPLWNAAQRQLLREGRIHNYLRMLWGKRVLAWTPTPRAALDVLFQLNDRYAVDGRDPNSVSGITWCLGRYDRPWGPERPIYGTVRYMTSASTMRKLRVKKYLARYGA